MPLIIDGCQISQQTLNYVLDAGKGQSVPELCSVTKLPQPVMRELRRRIMDEGLKMVPEVKAVFNRPPPASLRNKPQPVPVPAKAANDEPGAPAVTPADIPTLQGYTKVEPPKADEQARKINALGWKIMAALAQAESKQLRGNIADRIGMESAQISHQLKALRQRGYVSYYANGTYSLSMFGMNRLKAHKPGVVITSAAKNLAINGKAQRGPKSVTEDSGANPAGHHTDHDATPPAKVPAALQPASDEITQAVNAAAARLAVVPVDRLADKLLALEQIGRLLDPSIDELFIQVRGDLLRLHQLAGVKP